MHALWNTRCKCKYLFALKCKGNNEIKNIFMGSIPM